ncbi:hypothetical protein ACLB2K_052444 [Fragaria x ananassa]
MCRTDLDLSQLRNPKNPNSEPENPHAFFITDEDIMIDGDHTSSTVNTKPRLKEITVAIALLVIGTGLFFAILDGILFIPGLLTMLTQDTKQGFSNIPPVCSGESRMKISHGLNLYTHGPLDAEQEARSSRADIRAGGLEEQPRRQTRGAGVGVEQHSRRRQPSRRTRGAAQQAKERSSRGAEQRSSAAGEREE